MDQRDLDRYAQELINELQAYARASDKNPFGGGSRATLRNLIGVSQSLSVIARSP